MATAKKGPYVICPPREKVSDHVDEETAKEFATQFRVIPMFEKLLYEHSIKKHYSLSTNENLKCAWPIYKDNFETRVFAPFSFPSDRDLHFYNGMIRFLPSESIHLRNNHRMRYHPGPGIDCRGQLPIPQEAFFKRLSTNKKGHERKPTKKSEQPEEKQK